MIQIKKMRSQRKLIILASKEHENYRFKNKHADISILLDFYMRLVYGREKKVLNVGCALFCAKTLDISLCESDRLRAVRL